MEAFDFVGRTKLPRGPHAAHGPQVWKPCCTLLGKTTDGFVQNVSVLINWKKKKTQIYAILE